MNNPVIVENMELSDVLYYRDTPLVRYRIQYPHFESEAFAGALVRVNRHTEEDALHLEEYSRKNLFYSAVEQYHISEENGYPIMEFELIQAYEVTWNQDCSLSYYTDRYLYTGGAHGSTRRKGESWNLNNGTRLHLRQLMPAGADVWGYFTAEIIRQIKEQIEEGNDIYFPDYEKIVAAEFDPRQFFLKPEGLVIFFQHYDIAPYSSGIPVFLIPYSKRLREPRC